MMSERENIENSRKRYQTFITSERKPKKCSNSSSGNPITSSGNPITSSGSGKFITKKSGSSEPMTRDRSSGSEPISINKNCPITFKKWGMKSNEEGNLIHPGPGIIMPY